MKQAGRRALDAAASDRAIGHFDKALELEDDIEPTARAELLFHRGTAKRAQGLWEDAAADWKTALPIFEAERSSDFVARICWELAYQCVWGNKTDEAKAIAERGLRAVGEQSVFPLKLASG
ncbi:MAG TPA: hypothetical protein VLK65_18305 [Vicinamibacteria bacterium]|nr:hypothetical protein [Vicinamibacteria bacterium]